MFDLYNRVIKPSKRTPLPEIKQLRSLLISDDQLIDVVDFKTGKSKRTTVGAVAASSLSSLKFMNFLRLLTEYLKASVILETGTSLGLNAVSLSKSKSLNKVVSIEGSEIIHQLATRNCEKEPRIDLIQGDIYKLLGPTLSRYQPDVVFLDADHRASAIEFCLEQVMLHCPNVKCIVIHDIYWSPDMLAGWQSIVEDPKYSLTLDIFQAGLIFPNHPIVKQHFTLRF